MGTCEICGKEYQEDPWDPEGKLEAFLKEKYPELEDPVEWAITQVLPEVPYCVECAMGFFEGRES